MAFKWVNPGYGELFDLQTAPTKNNEKYNVKNQVCIGNVARNSLPPGKEFWLKCDIYSAYSGGTGFYLWLNPADSTKVGLHITSYDKFVEFKNGNNTIAKHEQIDITSQKLSSVVFHAKSDATNGVLEAYLDGINILTYTGNVNNGANFYAFGTGVDSTNDACMSNFIIADYDISNEEVTIVSLKDITGTWEGLSEGQSKATDVGQTLTHKIDVNALKTKMSKYSTAPTITSFTLSATGIQYNAEKVNAMEMSIVNGTNKLLDETVNIQSNNSLPIKTLIKNSSADSLDSISFVLKSAKV